MQKSKVLESTQRKVVSKRSTEPATSPHITDAQYNNELGD